MATIKERYEAFTKLAKQYCEAIENQSIRGNEGLRTINDLLHPLCLAAMHLPAVEGAEHLERSIQHSEWESIYSNLQSRLPCELYWDTFNPLHEPPGEVVAGSLADDLSDIWRDLKEGLVSIELGSPLLEVWWAWRFNFHIHWGAHAANALRVLYYSLRDSD